ncbi:MAG: TOBE domain-containing protein, partial [Streptosporangiaceae bacterium]
TGAGVRTIFGDLQLAGGADLEPGQVTVLVRPEQLEVRERAAANGNGAAGPGTGEAAVAGRVVACEYYGHDAVLRVQPAIHGVHGVHEVHEVIVRIAGGPSLPPGADVLVNARGPVLAWPRG